LNYVSVGVFLNQSPRSTCNSDAQDRVCIQNRRSTPLHWANWFLTFYPDAGFKDQPRVTHMAAIILDRLIRVGIVDDNELVRRTLHTILGCSSSLRVVAEAANGSAGLSLVELMRPDVVVMDISLPDMDGIEATRIISTKFPETKLVVLTMHNDQTYADTALQAGACQFLTKDCGREMLLNAIKECSPAPSRVVGNPPH